MVELLTSSDWRFLGRIRAQEICAGAESPDEIRRMVKDRRAYIETMPETEEARHLLLGEVEVMEEILGDTSSPVCLDWLQGKAARRMRAAAQDYEVVLRVHAEREIFYSLIEAVERGEARSASDLIRLGGSA